MLKGEKSELGDLIACHPDHTPAVGFSAYCSHRALVFWDVLGLTFCGRFPTDTPKTPGCQAGTPKGARS